MRLCILLLILISMPTAMLSAHPLQDRIWLPAKGQWVGQGELAAAMAESAVILIGERHGHEAHQEREAWLLQRLFAQSPRPALMLEMVDNTQAELVEQARARPPEELWRLGRALRWDARGWPNWPGYSRLFGLAFSASVPVLAGDVPMTVKKAVIKGGVAGLKAEQRQAWQVDGQPNQAVLASWRRGLHKAHCALLPADKLDQVTRLQWVRDGMMAARLAAAVKQHDGVVMVAGREHIRRDRSLPARLARFGIEPGRVFALALRAVEAGKTDPAAYLPSDPIGGGPFYDAVWFTAADTRQDPCELLKPAK